MGFSRSICLAFVMLGFLSPGLAWADYNYLQVTGSNSYSCAEVTPSGGFVNWVDDSYCTGIFGAHYNYLQVTGSNSYSCAEVTPSGGFVNWVDDSYCTGVYGAYYNYVQVTGSNSYSCAEVTPSGEYVNWVDDSLCTGVYGAHYNYVQVTGSSSYSCAEVTPSGGFVNWVDDSYCADLGISPAPVTNPPPFPDPTPVPQPNPPPAPSAWHLKELVDSAGVRTEMATVKGSASGTAMVLKCQAPSPAVKWSIQVPDVVYRAAEDSIKVEKDVLSVSAHVDGVSYTIDGWQLADHSMIVDLTPVTAGQNKDLKDGWTIDLVLSAKNSSGAKVTLDQMSFSLAGSDAIISELENRCAGAAVSLGSKP